MTYVSEQHILAFYSILFCAFMMLGLCLISARRNTKIQFKKNHLSIAVAKSSTAETPDRVYTKLGMPLLERYDFNLFLKQSRVGAERTSSGKSFQIVVASKAKLWPKCFRIYVQMDRIEERSRTFYLDGCILYYIFHNT